jgi:lactate racemase
MVALGTHPALSEAQLCQLVGITPEERRTVYRQVGILNHAWDSPDALAQIGVLPQAQIREIAGERWHPTLGGDVAVNINRAILATMTTSSSWDRPFRMKWLVFPAGPSIFSPASPGQI